MKTYKVYFAGDVVGEINAENKEEARETAINELGYQTMTVSFNGDTIYEEPEDQETIEKFKEWTEDQIRVEEQKD